ncbi:hypothetical protein K438DRAFT_1953015 [Mycena galopus ATCC 62051]|nr:hypothetical protein K438DRAFT_1953015 [Mycena galopus ATCC 62051]
MVMSAHETAHEHAGLADATQKLTNIPSTLVANLIELADVLVNEYRSAKQDWELERETFLQSATQVIIYATYSLQAQWLMETQNVGRNQRSCEACNQLTRHLTQLAARQQSVLMSKYATAVVYGQSHTVREYLAHLHVVTPGRLLQIFHPSAVSVLPLDKDTKYLLREAAISSLGGNTQIYPVQLNPRDWLADLSTSFLVEFDSLTGQLFDMQAMNSADIIQLEGEVQTAQAALDAARNTLSQLSSNTIIQMAYTMLDLSGMVNLVALAEAVGVEEIVLTQLRALLTAVQTAASRFSDVSRTLAHTIACLERQKIREEQLRMRIQTITSDLRELQRRWKALTLLLDSGAPLELPEVAADSWGRWTSATLTYDSNTRHELQMKNTMALARALWFQLFDFFPRSTLVTVDQPGWFQPAFFKESKVFYKVPG